MTMNQDLLRQFTELGDPTLLLLGGFGTFFLWTGDRRRVLARSWTVALGLSVLLTVASKFAFYFVGEGQRNPFSLRSPSGHVAMATGFYGRCALLLSAGRFRAARVLIYVGTTTLVGMLAASRIMLGWHTVPEIAAGFAIGAFCLAIFHIHLGSARRIVVNARQLTTLLLLIAGAHYSHVDGEPLLQRIAQKLDFWRTGQTSAFAAQGPGVTAQFRIRDRRNY
jgi:hypothetical protein